jgi:hypothetical protein
MIRYYSSRHLADTLQIPLNRWKRWAREFLPPDPLGGLQSGYARQFSTRDAFAVYMGGFLVGCLGFSIPQARQVLKDLSAWMRKHIVDVHLFGHGGGSGGRDRSGRCFEIHILGRPNASGNGSDKLTYRIRAIASRQPVAGGDPARWTETYTETILRPEPAAVENGYPPVCRLLEISVLANWFARLMKL